MSFAVSHLQTESEDSDAFVAISFLFLENLERFQRQRRTRFQLNPFAAFIVSAELFFACGVLFPAASRVIFRKLRWVISVVEKNFNLQSTSQSISHGGL